MLNLIRLCIIAMLVFATSVVCAEQVQVNNILGAVQGADGKMYAPTVGRKDIVFLSEDDVVYFNKHCQSERSDFWHIQKVCIWSGGMKYEAGVIKALSAGSESGETQFYILVIFGIVGIASMCLAMLLDGFAALVVAAFTAAFAAVATTFAFAVVAALTAASVAFIATSLVGDMNKKWRYIFGGVYIALMATAMFIT